MTGRTEREGYHHGDARNALLAAASELIENVGAAGLSLRQVAERAGLSRQAPYNHFDDKEALLAEIVREGFRQLATAVRDRTAAVNGRAALTEAASAYIEFARQAPARFRLMFSREIVDVSRFPEVAAAGADAFAALAHVVAGLTPASRVADLSLAAWSLVHGYATLCAELGVEGADRIADRSALFADLIADATASEHNQDHRT